ncbi:hypothetical protein Slin14017_G114580 [Septoria linicola]|nr:hypothetical protein Slin14017_G114580 [Septoria linicola]
MGWDGGCWRTISYAVDGSSKVLPALPGDTVIFQQIRRTSAALHKGGECWRTIRRAL